MADESFKQQWQASDHARHEHTRSTRDLAAQVQTLTQRNYELTALVTSLVDMLAAAGHVDANVLLATVEGQLDVEPVKSAPAATKGGGRTIHCARCGTEVAMSQAEMTGGGLMCPTCATS